MLYRGMSSRSLAQDPILDVHTHFGLVNLIKQLVLRVLDYLDVPLNVGCAKLSLEVGEVFTVLSDQVCIAALPLFRGIHARLMIGNLFLNVLTYCNLKVFFYGELTDVDCSSRIDLLGQVLAVV